MAFKVFRLIVGTLLGALAAWLAVGGVTQVVEAVSVGLTPELLIIPVLRIVGGLVILGLLYYALWAESAIKRVLENIFSIPELLRKLAFTLALLCIYRVGFHVPLPGLDQEKVASWIKGAEGVYGRALATYSMFTGGNLQQSTLFGLGIMPYISASIIFQLLATVVPALERLRKEGPAGYKKIQEYTRYLTVLLCLIQAAFWMNVMRQGELLYGEYQASAFVYIMGVVGLTTGTLFLMWLGEQIDEYGIGNGISLLIMAGIVSRLPTAINQLVGMSSLSMKGGGGAEQIGAVKVLFLVCAFIFVVAGAILITQAQRRIPVQQAKQVRGRRIYGGQRQFMPLRVNQGGVMPIIFASALMIFPKLLFGWMSRRWGNDFTRTVDEAFTYGHYMYALSYIVLIFFFAYFWTTVQFKPKDMADNLRDQGHFIPGLRPGKRTSDYLERVMERITYCGAAFLAAIAVVPMVVASRLGIPFRISAFLGGTGLLIIVSVTLELVQRIEANLVMRNYSGFLGGSTRIKGAYG
ncbi:MAG: preprotein translocase subunit SecY [Planctomycetota bacterium]|jgi:preprotein translocase subunit SecY